MYVQSVVVDDFQYKYRVLTQDNLFIIKLLSKIKVQSCAKNASQIKVQSKYNENNHFSFNQFILNFTLLIIKSSKLLFISAL